ncbi:MAG: hypothetical protein ACRC7O_01965 [Fimbriiglobus sp.]
MPRRFAAPTLAFALALAAGSSPAAEPDQLLKYIPAAVNSVAVVNTAAILRTPRAEREQWAKKDHTEFLAGAVPINPAVRRMLLANEFVPSHPAHGGGVAIASLLREIPLESVAKAEGGEIAVAGGEPAVATRAAGYVIQLGPQILGGMRTDHKPDVARWAKFAKTAERSLQSLYINRSVYNFGERFHILVAVDTEDLIHPAQARHAVAQSQVAAADKPVVAAVEKFVTEMTGVRFTANITDTGIDATLRIDSVNAPTMPPDVVKAFVIETLARNGAELTDIGAAAVRLEGGTVILSFAVTDEELARIMSVFVSPAAGLDDSEKIVVTPGGTSVDASKRYFAAIGRELDGLRGRRDRGQKFNTIGLWYETAAEKVGTLSIIGVDPELVKFGAGTAGRLADIGGSMRGLPIEAAKLQSQAYFVDYRPSPVFFNPFRGGLQMNYWGWGGGGVDTNIPQINAKIQQAIDAGATNRTTLWSQIDAERTRVRQEMTGKFGSNFAPAK